MNKFISIKGASISIDVIAKINYGSIRYDQRPPNTKHVQILLKNDTEPTDYFLEDWEIKNLQKEGFLQE